MPAYAVETKGGHAEGQAQGTVDHELEMPGLALWVAQLLNALAAQFFRRCRRKGSYQSRRPDCSIAAIHPMLKAVFETPSTRTASARNTSLVEDFGPSLAM
jgi:hypothetical protein